MTDELKFKHVNQKADLDNLVVGDKVEVSLGWPKTALMVYEGIINGKECFISNEKESSEEMIYSWRSERKHLQFFQGIIFFNDIHKNLKIYRPTQAYENAKKLLEQAGLMNNG